MPRFRKKPVEIEARQFDGTHESGLAIEKWINDHAPADGSWGAAFGYASRDRDDPYWGVEIRTLEGTMTADPGDYVIKGVQGEFYPCKPDIFAVTYDQVEG